MKSKEAMRNKATWGDPKTLIILVVFQLSFLIIPICLIFMLFHSSSYKEMKDSDITDFFSKYYGGTFEIISSIEKERCYRDYLDEDMEKLKTKEDDSSDAKDYIYKIKDKDGVEFHLVGFKRYGFFSSHYKYTDDYNVQLLKSKDVLYEKLDALGFPYTYTNTIGYEENPKASFNVNISCFDDVESTVTYICEMLSCEELELPWVKYSTEEYAINSIMPQVSLFSQGVCVWKTDFCYASQENVIDLESNIKKAEREYVSCVRSGSIEEELSDEVLRTYPPKEIREVYYQNEKVSIVLYYGIDTSAFSKTEWECYIVWDNPSVLNYNYKVVNQEGPAVYYDELNLLLNEVGYLTEYTEKAVIWTKGDNVVTIEINKKNEYICKHNGVVYNPEGIIDAQLLKLTEKDMQELFGITYNIDSINETAQININF